MIVVLDGYSTPPPGPHLPPRGCLSSGVRIASGRGPLPPPTGSHWTRSQTPAKSQAPAEWHLSGFRYFPPTPRGITSTIVWLMWEFFREFFEIFHLQIPVQLIILSREKKSQLALSFTHLNLVVENEPSLLHSLRSLL